MLTDPKIRPTPLTVLAFVCFIAGALLFLSALSLIIVGGVMGMNGIQVGSTDDPAIAFVFGFATLALAAGYVTLYYGFWALRGWAFTGGFLVAGAGIVLVLVGLPFGFGDATSALTNIVVGVAVMGVLLLPSSQAALGYVDASEVEPAAPGSNTSRTGADASTHAGDADASTHAGDADASTHAGDADAPDGRDADAPDPPDPRDARDADAPDPPDARDADARDAPDARDAGDAGDAAPDTVGTAPDAVGHARNADPANHRPATGS